MSEYLSESGHKKCSSCGCVKSVQEFYKRGDSDRLRSHCKACVNARNRQWNGWSVLDKKRNKLQHRKEARKKWSSTNKHKLAAQQLLRRYVSLGLIQKQPCEVCFSEKSEAHHDDYAKPLDVRWLCRKHHKQHHASC